jgi:CheY-like chemotaxis protein
LFACCPEITGRDVVDISLPTSVQASGEDGLQWGTMPALFYIDDSRDDLFYVDFIRKRRKLALEMVCFSTTQAALEVLEEREAAGQELPQLLIVDLYMPLHGGLSLIRKLRGDGRFSHMRLGVCSGSDADEDRSRALAAGADFYIEKPIDLDELFPHWG